MNKVMLLIGGIIMITCGACSDFSTKTYNIVPMTADKNGVVYGVNYYGIDDLKFSQDKLKDINLSQMRKLRVTIQKNGHQEPLTEINEKLNKLLGVNPITKHDKNVIILEEKIENIYFFSTGSRWIYFNASSLCNQETSFIIREEDVGITPEVGDIFTITFEFLKY